MTFRDVLRPGDGPEIPWHPHDAEDVQGPARFTSLRVDGPSAVQALTAQTLAVAGAADLAGIDTIRLTPRSDAVIATGAITFASSYMTVDTEAAAATDDLDTISGGSEGDLLILRAFDSTHTVVAKDGTGNLKLAGDFTMDNNEDILVLLKLSADRWAEVSRSDNSA